MQRDQWFTGFYCRISFHGCLFSSTYASSVYAFLCWIGNRLNDEPRSSIHDVLHKVKDAEICSIPGFFNPVVSVLQTCMIWLVGLKLVQFSNHSITFKNLQYWDETKFCRYKFQICKIFSSSSSAFAIFTILFLSATVFASNAHYQAKKI